MPTPSMEDYIEQIYILIEEKGTLGYLILRKTYLFIPLQ